MIKIAKKAKKIKVSDIFDKAKNKVKSYYIKSDWQKDYNKLHIKDLCSLYVKLQEGKRETIYSSKYVSEEEKMLLL